MNQASKPVETETYMLTTKAGTIHAGSTLIKCLQAYIEHWQDSFNQSPVHCVEAVNVALSPFQGTTVTHKQWVVVPEEQDGKVAVPEVGLIYISNNCTLDWATDAISKLAYIAEARLNSRNYHYYAANPEGWAVGRTATECLNEFYGEFKTHPKFMLRVGLPKDTMYNIRYHIPYRVLAEDGTELDGESVPCMTVLVVLKTSQAFELTSGCATVVPDDSSTKDNLAKWASRIDADDAATDSFTSTNHTDHQVG